MAFYSRVNPTDADTHAKSKCCWQGGGDYTSGEYR
jgi:hypothetical protein